MPMTEHFGACVRRLRTARGWSLRELARSTPVDPGYLCRIERGARQPTAGTASALDRALCADGELTALARACREANGRPAEQRKPARVPTGTGWPG